MYDSNVVFHVVEAELRSNPLATLGAISKKLKINRHTVTRVLKARGTDFKDLRIEAILSAAEGLLACEQIRSRKEVAFLLGFPSQSAFSHFLRRYDAASRLVVQMRKR